MILCMGDGLFLRVLHCVGVWCSLVQCASDKVLLQRVAEWCRVLQYVLVSCIVCDEVDGCVFRAFRV